MSDLDSLRDEANRKRRAVSSKIARIKKATGAEIAGTGYDPRREAGAHKRHNRATLNKSIAEMDAFLSRGTQFVGLAGGTPVPRGKWNAYKRNELEAMQVGQRHEDMLSEIPAPHRGDMTIGQAKAMVPKTQGSAVHGPYRRFDRSPQNFESLEGLEDANRQMLNMLNAKFLPTKIAAGKENLKKVLNILGESEAAEDVDSMSAFQFDVLWYGEPDVIERLFMKYEVQQLTAADPSRKERWQDRASENAIEEFGSVSKWVRSNVPNETPENNEWIQGIKR